ncbi:MAG: VapC toxin family PIN domain ribonuclease [Opitutus sp.]|nr:VapC toxin family PIN domain ribonuclease [Opitutus sp.]
MIHLLDINVMIAAAWPAHIAHGPTVRWFARRQSTGVLDIATCPLTELGFLRLSLVLKGYAPDLAQAQEALRLLMQGSQRRHHFWSDALPARRLPDWVLGPQQITDGYLVALVVKNSGRLVTLDTSIPTHAAVELIA